MSNFEKKFGKYAIKNLSLILIGSLTVEYQEKYLQVL